MKNYYLLQIEIDPTDNNAEEFRKVTLICEKLTNNTKNVTNSRPGIRTTKKHHNKSGCGINYVKEKHDRKCETCEMHSATLYELKVGIISFNICCFCKSTIRSDIERIEGHDCY